ncbi:MAG: hypothetical protein K2I89_00915 [Muribaculaceae bacterium]|nr:hypothetical protein [Muribaculaceae bacterium]
MFSLRNFITFSGFAAVVSLPLVAKLNLPQNEETAYLHQIVIPERFANDCLWDFSECEIIGNPMEARFEWQGDSCLSATLPGIRYDFDIKGDTVFHTVTESHYQCLSDTLPLICALPASASVSGRYASRGRSYHSEYTDAYGDMTLTALGQGTIILPSGDTIANVTLTRLSTRQHIAKALHTQPSAASVSEDSLPKRTTIEYTWVSDSYPVPLVRYNFRADSLGEEAVGQAWVWSWMCSPSNQPFRANNRNFNRKDRSSALLSPYGDDEAPLTAMALTADNSTVSVSGTAACDGRIAMLLTDVVGRVFSSMPPTEFHGGSAVEWTADGLPDGQYVLYISRDGSTPVAYKIILH